MTNSNEHYHKRDQAGATDTVHHLSLFTYYPKYFLNRSTTVFKSFHWESCIEHVCVRTADWKMCVELGASVPAHWRLSPHRSSVFSSWALTPEVTGREWGTERLRAVMTAAHGAAQPASTVKRLQGTFGELVSREISKGRGTRACDRLWTFPFIPVGQGIESLHREVRYY